MTRFAAALILASALTTPAAYAQTASRSLTVSASHTLTLAPAEADISVSVQYEADSAKAVEAKMKAGLDEIRASLRTAGKELRRVATSNMNINARTRTERVYSPDGKFQNVPVTTYTLRAQHVLTIAPAGDSAALSSLVLADGVSQVSRFVFRAELPVGANKTARAEALKAAENEAREIARSFGMTIGKPSRVQITDTRLNSAAITNMDPDKLNYVATANVTFDLIE